jgi:hypothetical protein
LFYPKLLNTLIYRPLGCGLDKVGRLRNAHDLIRNTAPRCVIGGLQFILHDLEGAGI